MGSKRLKGALLDRLTHRVYIIKANAESYRLRQAKKRQGETRLEAKGEQLFRENIKCQIIQAALQSILWSSVRNNRNKDSDKKEVTQAQGVALFGR